MVEFSAITVFGWGEAVVYSKKAYPALLLTAVRLLTPVFSKLLIRFSGIPHRPKPVNEGIGGIYKMIDVSFLPRCQ